MKDFSNEIWGYSLKNAIEFGKTDAGKILPKLFQHGLEKDKIKEVMPKINEIIKKVNSLSKEEREKEFLKYSKYVKEREEEEKKLGELSNVRGKPVLRIAPFPSGALHLGNAKTFLLNAIYAERYKGKLILVMDDTIGSIEKPIEKEAYELIIQALKWLGIKYDKKIIYKSDRLDIYYKYAEELIKKDKSYVCHCSADELREMRAKGKECACRQFPVDIQMKRWKDMFEAREGEATLRIKTDMKHPNPAFRDRVLFKISERKHPRVGNKYSVWPTLEMSWAIDDHLLGITHIIRGNDLMIESDMERYIWDVFNWKNIEIIHTGFVRIEGTEAKISKSKAREEVKSGKFIGWDDPRTWSMQSLERRGIKAEAIREFVKEIGLNKQDITVPIDSLYAINRKIVDFKANRYYFVEAPVKIDITTSHKLKNIEIPIHPEKKEKRKVKVTKSILVSSSDFNELKGEEVRLLHLFNVNLNREAKITSFENKEIPKIQWVSGGVNARVLMPNGEWISGLAEPAIKKLKKDEIIQFERFGFVKYDRKNKDFYEFWFAHR